jgi:hypothetical protein
MWVDAALAVDPGSDNPAAQARNLFHLSAAMWDAWAAYGSKGSGYFVTEKHGAEDVLAAREAAISYAAYRLRPPDGDPAFALLPTRIRQCARRLPRRAR